MKVFLIRSYADDSVRAVWATREKADADVQRRNRGRYQCFVEEWEVTQSDALPAWSDCEQACDDGSATTLQRFIYNNEPGSDDGQWRRDLAAVIREAKGV